MSDIKLLSNERLDIVNENIRLIQKKDGLTFGTDAFLLASFIKSAPRKFGVELGSGTGIISLLLAERKKLAKITAIELQEDFSALTQRNAELNSLDRVISVINADATQLRADDIGKEADIVFSNPPYMKINSGKRNQADSKFIARHEVCGNINGFCEAAFRLLKHGGKFYVVWRPDRICDLFYALRVNRLEPKLITFVHADAQSEPSMALISAIKGGASGSVTSAPLILYNDASHTQMSEDAKKIYDTLSFESFYTR